MDAPDAAPRVWPSKEPIRHNGITFDRRRCGRIQRIIRDCPNITRVALAQRVCEMLGWRRFNGELPERACRNLLDRLHKHGWIELPPSRRPKNATQRPRIPAADDPLPDWPDVGPREGPSCPLLVRPILPEEKAAFRRWIQHHHYLGYRPLVGESLCYAAFWKGQPVALLAWSAASLKNAPRDAYIGWDEPTKLSRLPFVVQNVRFLILPHTDVPAHFASRVLAANLRRLCRDWQAQYRHPVLLAETFVDESRFQGTCYRAANWIRLGLTRGFGRHSTTYRHHGVPKAAWIYPLRADALSRLRNTPGTPTPFLIQEDAMSQPALKPEALPLAGDGGLLDLLLSIPEVRKPRGLRHPIVTVLALSVLAMLLGKRSFLAIAQFAANLSPELLKTLGARRKTPPSESTFRRVLARAPADEVDTRISRWLIDQGIRLDEAIALDGKVSRGSADGDTAAVHLLSALLQREGIVIRQVRVSDKTNEIPCVRPLLQDLPIEGAMVTADALHTQQDTARFLVEEKKADYLFIAKDNQPTLRKDIELLGLTAIPPSG